MRRVRVLLGINRLIRKVLRRSSPSVSESRRPSSRRSARSTTRRDATRRIFARARAHVQSLEVKLHRARSFGTDPRALIRARDRDRNDDDDDERELVNAVRARDASRARTRETRVDVPHARASTARRLSIDRYRTPRRLARALEGEIDARERETIHATRVRPSTRAKGEGRCARRRKRRREGRRRRARLTEPIAGRRARGRDGTRGVRARRARGRERRACASSREREGDSAREGERCARWEARGRARLGEARGLVVVAGSEGEGAAVTAKKPRLPALDSIRFFLIAYIGVGHFIACGEEDVDVGGAVAGERRRRRLLRAERIRRGVHDDRVGTLRGADEEVATESKVFHQSSDGILSVVFRRQRALRADVFLRGFLLQRTGRGGCARIDDVYAHAIVVSDARGIMERAVVVFELVRLLFGGVTVRAALHRSVQPRKQFDAAFKVLVIVSLLAKLAYSYDLNAWGFMEGVMSAKTHPNWLYFNSVRFSPFSARS